jgi:hypothetical protein
VCYYSGWQELISPSARFNLPAQGRANLVSDIAAKYNVRHQHHTDHALAYATRLLATVGLKKLNVGDSDVMFGCGKPSLPCREPNNCIFFISILSLIVRVFYLQKEYIYNIDQHVELKLGHWQPALDQQHNFRGISARLHTAHF